MKIKHYPIQRGAIKIPVPDVTQTKDYACGAAALEAICKYYGVGKEDDWEFVKALGMDPRVGSHPFQIRKVAKQYGLHVREKEKMTLRELKEHLQKRRPVLLMIQAWGRNKSGKNNRWTKSYKTIWSEGHWVVAIGYDRQGFFFEDPSLQGVRGYIPNNELEERWHDIGPHNIHMAHFGMAIWKPAFRKHYYTIRAEKIY